MTAFPSWQGISLACGRNVGFVILIVVSFGAFGIDVLLCQKHLIRKTHHITCLSRKILSFWDPKDNRDLQTDIFCQNHHA